MYREKKYFFIFLLTNILTSGIISNVPLRAIQNARVAQLVERDLAKVEAAGSSPVSRFSYAPERDFRGVFQLFRKTFNFDKDFVRTFIFC